MSKNSVLNRIAQLARLNGTSGMLHEVSSFVEHNFVKFAEDYQNTSQKDRFSTGKLEKRIFTYLADLCNWNNGNDNAQYASSILNDLGYHSYKMKEKRFRQKVENEKKKRKGLKGRSIRSASRKYNTSRKMELEESYSESDGTTKDVYFPKNKGKYSKIQQQVFDVHDPLHQDNIILRGENIKEQKNDNSQFGDVTNREKNKPEQEAFETTNTTNVVKPFETTNTTNDKAFGDIPVPDEKLSTQGNETSCDSLQASGITVESTEISIYNAHWDPNLDGFLDYSSNSIDNFRIEHTNDDDRFLSLNPPSDLSYEQMFIM